MDDPVSEIPGVINTLCSGSPSAQQNAVETYFTRTASFTHPFCRTGSFAGSRWLVLQIYQWYKILSPHIDVTVDSVAFDETNLLLYVSIHQTFKIWLVPFYKAQPSLVTILTLTTEPEPDPSRSEISKTTSQDSIMRSHQNYHHQSSPPPLLKKQNGKKYFIQSQNDLYQTSEFVKFVLPWGIGVTAVTIWQIWATFFCVVGALLGRPMTVLLEKTAGRE